MTPACLLARVEGARLALAPDGIFLMENLMDEVSFETTSEGSVVKMIIYLDKPQ